MHRLDPSRDPTHPSSPDSQVLEPIAAVLKVPTNTNTSAATNADADTNQDGADKSDDATDEAVDGGGGGGGGGGAGTAYVPQAMKDLHAYLILSLLPLCGESHAVARGRTYSHVLARTRTQSHAVAKLL